MTPKRDELPDEEIGTIEFTQEDCKAIASLPLPSLKDILTVEQYKALEKFVFINQVTHG